jgi:hypothetical protein
MDKLNFLNYVLPVQGYYATFGIKGKANPQVLHDTPEEAIAACEALVAEGYDTYFGCAKYNTNYSREAKNAKYFKSFWLDIDCGPNKAYLTQDEGIAALKSFCLAMALPKPTLVNSGNGVHCYWVLEEEITYNDWKPVADYLKVICNQQKFSVDPAVTADAARVLRVPGTYNFKNRENPKLVEVISFGPRIYFQAFKDALGYVEGVATEPTIRGVDAMTKALMGGVSSRFATIMQKSARGNGCPQLLHIYKNQNAIDEPLWRAGLSIAQFCVDRDVAIHKLSNQCDEYDPAETEDKASRCQGPHTCATFENLNPLGCTECPVKGSIKSPILLGRFVEHATPEDNILTTTHEGLGKETTIIIPEYPFPYFRKKDGGVYMTQRSPLANGDESEEAEEVMIYEFDLFVEKRLTDPDSGEVVLIKLILKNDGIREFTAPLADILSRDKARAILAYHGVAAMQKKMDGIMNYLTKFVQVLQVTTRAEIARSQFGWHDNDTTFLIGTRQISSEGVTYSPPSVATEEVALHYGSKGHLPLWTEVADLYGRPGNEARAFALGVSFGAPFVKFSGIRGFILHLTNEKSGVGKSTIQHVANSVWGHPVNTMLTFDDKPLARQHRFGVLNNIVSCIDEITDLGAEEAGHTAFMVTQGKGRDRMQSQVNAIRKNNTTWDLPVITSGNNSLHDLLYSNKVLPEGELMRILEVYIEQDNSLTKQESDKYFGQQLLHNYGMAGEVIAEYIIKNKEECLALMHEIREDFDRRANFKAKERFYSSACAVAFTGLEIAQRCGLHSIDIPRVKEWVLDTLGKTLATFSEDAKDGPAMLGEFINSHMQNLLVIEGITHKGLTTAPLREPRGELLMRYEPDTKTIYIASTVFRDWCAEKQIPYKNLCEKLKISGLLRGRGAKRLSAGMSVSSPPIHVLEFNTEGTDSVFADISIK